MNMKVRIYPRVRMLLKPSEGRKWGDFEPVPGIRNEQLGWLMGHFKNYWSNLKIKPMDDHLEVSIEKGFYNRYMQCYDHTIFKEGKWKNGISKEFWSK